MDLNTDNIKSQMRKGMLEYCVLLILKNNKLYPSDILRILTRMNMVVVEGTIYTLLNRMRKEGKLNYEWQESTQGPPRKYFYITAYGIEVLDAMGNAWTEISNVINSLKHLDTNEENL